MPNAADKKPFVGVHRVLITVSGQSAYSYFSCTRYRPIVNAHVLRIFKKIRIFFFFLHKGVKPLNVLYR